MSDTADAHVLTSSSGFVYDLLLVTYSYGTNATWASHPRGKGAGTFWVTGAQLVQC